MIIIDTNVLLEPMRPTPDSGVLRWIDRHALDGLYFTSISLAEILSGIERLPEGRRKRSLLGISNDLTKNLFAGRILPFDAEAAQMHAELNNRCLSKGFAIDFADCQIAAIASIHGFTVATRDIVPFQAAGVAVINPWDN